MWFLSRCQDLIGSLASTHSTFNLIGSCNKHPNIESYKDTKLQSYKVTKLQRYKATKIHTLTPLTYELFFQNSSIRICMGIKPTVSVTYENKRISIKNSLPYLKCVFRLSCVVHGPIYGLSMGFLCKQFSLYIKFYPRGGGVLPYITYTGMCRPTGSRSYAK